MSFILITSPTLPSFLFRILSALLSKNPRAMAQARDMRHHPKPAWMWGGSEGVRCKGVRVWGCGGVRVCTCELGCEGGRMWGGEGVRVDVRVWGWKDVRVRGAKVCEGVRVWVGEVERLQGYECEGVRVWVRVWGKGERWGSDTIVWEVIARRIYWNWHST